jgi:hypothetical protein
MRGVLFVLVLCMGAVGLAAPASPPRIVCDATMYDFGERVDIRPVSHVFTIRNTGGSPLDIRRVRACCGATARMGTMLIPPGSNTTLTISLWLNGRRGNQRKSFYVSSNDPQTPNLQLVFIGTVIAAEPQGPTRPSAAVDPKPPVIVISDLQVIPKEMILTVHAEDPHPVSCYVALRSRSKTPFEITSIDIPGEDTDSTVKPMGAAGWRCKLDGLIPAVELHGSNIIFHTTHPEGSEISIPINVVDLQE